MRVERWTRSYLLRVAAASTLAWASVLVLWHFTGDDPDMGGSLMRHSVVDNARTVAAAINPIATTALAAVVVWLRPGSWLCRGAKNRWVFACALTVFDVVGALLASILVEVSRSGVTGIADGFFWTIFVGLAFFAPLVVFVAGVIVGPPAASPSAVRAGAPG